MAHEIAYVNGQHCFGYVGEKGWHGLGQQLTVDSPREEWVTKTGFNFELKRAKVRFATGPVLDTDSMGTMEDRHVILRSDNLQPLAIVSDGFQIVQPRTVFDWMFDLTREIGCTMETAGVLKEGRKFFALARMGPAENIVGTDLVRAYLMLATACDGSMKTCAANVATRTVCANTVRIAMSETGNRKVEVSHRTAFDGDRVKREMGLCVSEFYKFISDARELAKRTVSPTEAQTFVAAMVEQPDLKLAQEMAGYKRILSLFNGEGKGANLPGVRGTAWGLVNAVTEYVDHHARAHSFSNRLDSAWFGAGDEMKDRAQNEAMKLAA